MDDAAGRATPASIGSAKRGCFAMTESREVMNVRQASQYLGISPDTLYKYVAEERIPAFKLGNRWRFKKTTLDRWMEKQSAVKAGGERASR
jgi:excisionase family DNA binding protein